MGTCYSKKASGGNNPYMISPMAATKLDEASRLGRPTPYARSGNANIEFAAKKNVPLPTKFNALATVEQGDIKNLKHYQSSIPRFSSSLPTATGEQRITSPSNENETLHVVNNNAIVNSRSAFNVSSTSPSSSNRSLNKPESLSKPKNIASKSCPDKILSPDNERIVRTPARGSGLSRQIYNKSPAPQSETKVGLKSQQGKTASGRNSCGPSPVSKSPSRKGFDSRDSLSDFDSGIGNSLTDKNRPEDSDTVKDLEQLELQEESSPNLSTCKSSAGTPKSLSDTKLTVKAPSYKREPNGKWSFDDKHFGPESTLRTNEPKSIPNSGPNSPRDKHAFKMTASENIFSTYASYKGLLSYQKKSFKSMDNGKLSPKMNRAEKSRVVQSPVSNLSSIPKIRRHASQPSPGGSIFYCHNEENQCSEKKYDNASNGLETVTKPNNDMKQSSLDSDEKSDSTGVLSPPSEESREFLIDDEIADQPGLTLCNDPKSEDSDVQSLQMAMSELHALQMSSSVKKRTDSVSSFSSRKGRFGDHRDSLILGSELGSSCSSIASDDLMLDYEKPCDGFPEGTVNEGPASPMRKLLDAETDKVTPLKKEKKFDFEEKTRKRMHRKLSGPLSTSVEWRQRTVSLPLRPPRPMSVCEADDGGLKLDSSSYRLLCQDLNGVKTLLLRLKSVIQEAETINPFDQSNPNNIFYHSLVQNDPPSNLASCSTSEKKTPDLSSIYQENADMKRQLVLLQQQLEEKDHTINLLQQQMTKYLNIQGNCNHVGSSLRNSATQTERSRSLTASLSSSSSADDSIETLVSAQEDFEKSFKRNSKDQDVLSEHLIEVVRLLDHNSTSYPTQSEC